jgi:hypothetical protein
MIKDRQGCVAFTLIILMCFIIVILFELNDNDDNDNINIVYDDERVIIDNEEYMGNFCELDWVLTNDYYLEIMNFPEGGECVEYNYQQTIINDDTAKFEVDSQTIGSEPILIYSGIVQGNCNDDLIETCYLR